MKAKLGSEASISIGTSPIYYLCTTSFYFLGLFLIPLDVIVACAITYPSVSEKGEVISTHYKLFSADIRDIPKLDSVIRLAEMDPR